MPNHCYQQVHIEGPHQIVSMLYHGLTENGFNHDDLPRIDNPQFCQFEIDEELTSDEGLIADKLYDGNRRSWFAFRCWTAWGPPVPVWDKLQKMGIKIHADYQDEGGMFEGEYINGYNRSWEPEIEEEEEAHAV